MPRPVPHTLTLMLSSAILLAGCASPTSSEHSDRLSGSAGALDVRDAPTGESGAAIRDQEAVARASAAEVAAFMAADPAALANLWSDGFVVTNPFNQFVTKEQVLGLVSSGVLAFSSYDRTIEYAHSYGKLVIVAGSETVVWAGRIPLAGQLSRLRYTAVWERHGNEWREVARHANLILPGVPGGPPTR